MAFYAHSHPAQPTPGDKWQPLAEHLRGVAQLARQFAEAARRGDPAFADAAYAAGLLHDVGKYTTEFQKRLRQEVVKRVPHAIHGATHAGNGGALDVAFAIAGHHAGMPSRAALQAAVGNCALDPVWRTATQDMPELRTFALPQVPASLRRDLLRAEVRIRLLFSCLVDADFLDTEQHFEPDKAVRRSSPPLEPQARLEVLMTAVSELARRSMPDGVRAARRHVLDQCLNAAESPPGFFSLTVPTGGGKTLASMAFALKHAAQHSLRRIIYVLPYLNIIEQNADVLRQVFGAAFVLEHHSLTDDRDDDAAERRLEVRDDPETPRHRLAAENWEAPLVVTTNVQFFQSLFANRPGRCRKLHRIPRSVVILDECQTLPPGLLEPMMSMLQTLVADYETTVVFCTATQPAFRRRAGFEGGIPAERLHEIVPDHARLFDQLRRTDVTWPLAGDTRTLWLEIASRIVTQTQVLCVVNLRRHAAELYRLVSKHLSDGVFHLSTNLCPAHRRDVLGQIRTQLEESRPCRVIATQLVEAGVDLDFPCVMRALGPLDSIAQAAGRCNREGKLADAHGNPGRGRVEVFIPEDDSVPSGVYCLATQKTRALLEYALSRGERGPNIHDPTSFDDYFRRLYADTALDAKDLQTSADSPRRTLDFPETAARFELIPNATISVIVPYDAQATERIDDLRGAIARVGFPPAPLVRALQRYLVQRWPHEFEADQREGRVEPLTESVWLWTGTYDSALGILAEEPTFGPNRWVV